MDSYTALAAISMAAGSASARELACLRDESIAPCAFHGIVYYTKERNGFRVVTTIAAREGGLPLRFVTTLTEGQQFVVSFPGETGEFSRVLEISCVGGKPVLTTAETTPETVSSRC
jgi:hypothetical protein